MDTVQIKSKKGLLRIGGKVIGQSFVSVNADDLDAYARTSMGAKNIKARVEFKAERNPAAKENLELVALKEEMNRNRERMESLEIENGALKAELVILKSQAAPVEEIAGDSVRAETPDIVSASKGFAFDPAIHSVEHRGAGKYFVMDESDNKVYGPLTEDEKVTFMKMIEG